MKLVLRRSGWAAAVLLAAASVGCTDEQTGFFILGNVSLEAPACVARADATSTLISAGVLDVALKPDYEASLLVGSQLAPRGDKANLRTETMIATITGAEVHLYRDTGELDGAAFTVPAAGVILPDSSEDPGFGVVTATLIPAATGVALADELVNRAELRTRVAEVIVFGRTIGGLDIETAPLSYVIRVCEGCLIDFPSEAVTHDPQSNQASCSIALDNAPLSPCRVGQDDPVDCRICQGDNDFCLVPGGVAP
jgi:hypothetical protein